MSGQRSADRDSPVPGRHGGSGVHPAWKILAGCVVIELFGLGFGIFAVTSTYPFLVEAFPEWSRTEIFAATSIIIATVGIMGPITGSLIDRIPVRPFFLAGISVQVIALLWFANVSSLSEYYGASLLLGLGMSAVTILPNEVVISRWFRRRIGLVNGILLAATALGAAASPPLITRLIVATDWHTAFLTMACAMASLPTTVVLLVLRDRPESVGSEPFGAALDERADTKSALDGMPLQTAVRTPAFWILVAVIFLAGFPCYSYNKHMLLHLTELGFEPVQAADMKGIFFLLAGCSRLSFGWLCDRFDPRRVTLAHFSLIAAASALLMVAPTFPSILLPAILIMAVGYGAPLPAMPILVLGYFGRHDTGRILGAFKVPYDLAAAGAPLLTAKLRDEFGTYELAHAVATAFALAAVALIHAGLPRLRN